MVFLSVVASAALREGIIIIIEANSLGGSYGAVSLSWCLTKATRNERICLKKLDVCHTWHIKPKNNSIVVFQTTVLSEVLVCFTLFLSF